MSERILFVDDDPHVLEGIQRQLRKKFVLDLAQGGEAGLEQLTRQGPYAVVVSDMRMPGLSGVQFLRRVRELAPDTVRVMLTGYAEQQTAIDAVNEGNIFRFLTKPCDSETLARAVAAGIEQYRLVTAEKVLIEKTLRGSVKVLTEVLSLVNPTAFGRATRLHRLVKQFAAVLRLDHVWHLELAAMLSQLGCVTVPEAILKKAQRGDDLEPEEARLLERHPRIGHDLIAHIPRLETVAQTIAFQEKRFDGSGIPANSPLKGTAIPLGARILKLAQDFDSLEANGLARAHVVDVLAKRTGWYDPALLTVMREVAAIADDRFAPRALPVSELAPGMILAQDLLTVAGLLLVGKGQEISPLLLHRLDHYAVNGTVHEPIQVLVPLPSEAEMPDLQEPSPPVVADTSSES